MLEVKSQMKFSRGEDAGNQVDLRCVCFALCVWWTRAYLCVRGSKKRPVGRVGQVTASAISGGNHNENGTAIL